MAWTKVLKAGGVAASDISSGSISTTYTDATANTGTVTSVGTSGTVSGITLTGTVTSSGTLTLGGSVSTLNQNTTGSSATCSGLAGSATVLATSRNIAGNSFNGSSAITIDIEDLDNVTVSDSAANGSPSTGDIWIEY